MSDNTQDSGSSRRSFRGRIPISASDATSSLKNGLSQLGGSISRGVETIKGKSANLNGRFGRESSVYSKAVRELDNYGYERYNISDESEIFISKVSDRVDFDADGADTMLVRATGGNFVGSAGLQKATFTVPQEEKVEDARSLFGNVITRAPAETEFTATVGVNRDGDIGHVSKPEVNVGRAPIAKFAEETPVVEAPAAEPERKVPDYMSRIRSGSRPVPKAHVEETPAVETVEVPVVEAPVEAPVIEEADEDEPIIMAVPQVEETPVVEAVEEAVVEEVDEIVEAPVEAPVIEEPAELFIIQETPEVEETVEAPIIEEVTEAPAEEIIEEVPVEEPVVMTLPETIVEETVEAPAEAPAETRVREEFFIDTDETEVPEAEASEVEDDFDEYDLVFGTEDEPAEEPIEGSVEIEEVPEAPAEEPVVMTLPETVEDAAEAPVVEEVPEAPVVEEIAVEAPAEEPMEVRASLPGVGAVISGLYTEGDNPSSDAATVDVTAATIAAETAETGCDAAETPRVSGIDSYGEALPPMSDPVVRRPRSVRFRFNNGVLMNVDKGSEEGSRGPLE